MGAAASELARRIALHYSEAFRVIGRAAEPGQHEEGNGWHRILTRQPHFIANSAILEATDFEGARRAVEPLVNPEFPSSVLFVKGEVSEDVHQLLVGNVYRHAGGIPLMAAPTASLAETGLPAGVEMRDMRDDLGAWGKAMAAGYGLPEELGRLCARAAKDPRVRIFGAVENGKVLSTSMLLLHDGLAGIYCVATLPEARGRGLGAHLTAEPLRMAAGDGFETGVLQSSEMGYPIYRRIGFKDHGTFPIYIRDPMMGHGPS